MKLDPEKWLESYHEAGLYAREKYGSLTDEQFNWKPNPKKWSVGQCVEHLHITGSLVLPRLENAIHKAESKNKPPSSKPLKAGFFERWFLRMSGEGGKPVPAPPLYKPDRSELDRDEILRKFEQLQMEASELVRRSSGLRLDKLKVASPYTRFLRLSVAMWFELMASHQKRHFAQADRVLDHPEFPE